MLSDEVRAALFASPEAKAKKDRKGVLFRCPRHEDGTPSAWMVEGSWGCYACGFTEPITTLAEHLGVVLKGSEPKGYSLEDYAEAKGFPADKLRGFGLSTTQERGRDVVRIPYFDAEGNVLRCRFRYRGDKWWEGRNRPIYLYGLDRLTDTKPGDTVLVVEGESDCHAAWLAGFHAVGVPGATTWKHEWAEHLGGLDLVVWEEPDQGGAQLVAGIAADFPTARVIQDPPAKDLADLRRKYGGEFGSVLRSLMAQAPRIGTPKPPVAFEALLGERLNALLKDKQKPIDAVPTPFPGWNNCCADDGGRTGLARGWHVVAAAKTGKGKSILALNLAAHAIRCGERVCFVSLEMSQTEVDTRLLAILSGEPVYELEKGSAFSVETFKKAGRYVSELHEQTGGCFWTNREPIHELRAVIDSMRFNYEVHGCRFFVTDYLQLAGNPMDPDSIAKATHEIRAAAKTLNVISVGLSQFNRTTSSSSDRPASTGLMGGGPLEQDSDQVMLIDHSRVERLTGIDWRTGKEKQGWSSYLLLDKNRHGPLVDIPFQFDSRTLQMREQVAAGVGREEAA